LRLGQPANHIERGGSVASMLGEAATIVDPPAADNFNAATAAGGIPTMLRDAAQAVVPAFYFIGGGGMTGCGGGGTTGCGGGGETTTGSGGSIVFHVDRGTVGVLTATVLDRLEAKKRMLFLLIFFFLVGGGS
jgi:hypothetical protein